MKFDVIGVEVGMKGRHPYGWRGLKCGGEIAYFAPVHVATRMGGVD